MQLQTKQTKNIFLLATVVFGVLSLYLIGCEKGPSTNSVGPTRASQYTLNLTASNTVLQKGGGSVTLTATVYGSTGALIDGVAVDFSSNPTGVSGQVTTANGQAALTATITQSTTVVATLEGSSVQLRIVVMP